MTKKVTIYTTHSCPWCHKAVAFFQANNVEYIEKMVDDDQEAAQEMINKSNQTAVPVIDIEGQIMIGFDELKLRELLEIKE